MFKLSEIKELIKLVDQSSLQEVEIESEGARLMIRKPKPSKAEPVIVASAPMQHTYAPVMPQSAVLPHNVPAAPAEPPAAVAIDSNLHKIVSPMVGTFYQAPSPDAPPFVSVGSAVNEKTVVCIVEAMKLMNPLEAEVKGEIVEVLVENGQLVEYGQPLFLVRV